MIVSFYIYKIFKLVKRNNILDYNSDKNNLIKDTQKDSNEHPKQNKKKLTFREGDWYCFFCNNLNHFLIK